MATTSPNASAVPEDPSSDPNKDATGEGITAFLSYTRLDNEVLNFIPPFKKYLQYFVGASSPELSISLFQDTDDIDWGEDWRAAIDQNLKSATIFIPFLSANYIKSDSCRKEFLQFYNGARDLGVTDLILPVLVNDDGKIFSTDSDNELVAMISGLNWERIDNAVLTDDGSSTWLTTMSHVASRFIKSYRSAETRLLQASESEDSRGGAPKESPMEASNSPEDERGLLDINIELGENVRSLTAIAQNGVEPIQQIGAIAKSAGDNPPTDMEAAQKWAIRAAHDFKAPAEAIGHVGKDMFEMTQKIDVDVRALARLQNGISQTDGQSGGPRQLADSLGNLEQVRDQLNGLLESFRVPESMSGALRKALRPARTGLTYINDSIMLMASWRDLE